MNNEIFTKPGWCSSPPLNSKPLLGEPTCGRRDHALIGSTARYDSWWPQKSSPSRKLRNVPKEKGPFQKDISSSKYYDFQGIIKKEMNLLEDASLIFLRDPDSPSQNGFMEWKYYSFRRRLDTPYFSIIWQYDRMPGAWSTPMKSKL